MEKVEKALLKAISTEISMLRIGLPILTAVLVLQVVGLTMGIIIM